MKKIRWGIIGCGDVTERKSGPAFSKVADSEIEQVVQTLLGKGSCVSMGASAADTNRVMEMILGRK